MISRFPRSIYLLNSLVLSSFSIFLLFEQYQQFNILGNGIWVDFLFFSVLSAISLLLLTSEWFERKNTAKIIVYVIGLSSLVILAGYLFLINAYFPLIILASVLLINVFSMLNLVQKNILVKPSALTGIVLSIGILVDLVFFEPFISILPILNAVSWSLLSLPIISAVLAGLSGIFQKKTGLSKIFKVISILPLIGIAVFFTRDASQFINAFVLIIFAGFILIADKIERTLPINFQLNNRWNGYFFSILGLVIVFLTVLSGTSFFLLTFIQNKNSSAALNLSQFFALLTFACLFIVPFLFELIRKRMNVHFSSLALQGRDIGRSTSYDNTYFSSPILASLSQSLHESADKSQTLSKLREVFKTQKLTASEKQLRSSVSSLSELSEKLEDSLDLPVSAQFLTSILQKTIKSGFIGVFTFNPDERRLIPLAIESNDFVLPAGFRLRLTEGSIDKAIRMQTGLISEENLEINAKHPALLDSQFHSFIFKPLFREGYLEGLILLADQRSGFFSQDHLDLVEIAGSQLLSAWSRFGFVNAVANMIESSSSLSNINELSSILQRIVEISRQIIKNQFTAVVFSVQEKVNFTFNGKAPELRNSIETHLSQLSNQVFRISENVMIRDCRRDQRTSYLSLDEPELRTLLICPIRIHGLNIGALLFFGKRKGLSFTEQDSFIAGLLAMQSAALIEGCLLDQELRNNLINTQLLHGLNLKITQANDLPAAADAITETAYRLSQAESAGLVLYSTEGKIETQSFLSDKRSVRQQPRELIQRAMNNKEISSDVEPGLLRKICFPIYTSRRVYGGLWLNLTDDQFKNDRLINELNNLVHQASIALERSILLKETREKADQISMAYYQLQTTYDQTLMALVSAIDLRDRETEGHSLRVAQLALAIGNELELSPADLKALERGSLLHDVGKIGISDAILHKPGPLTVEEWKIMRSHPEIGAQIIESIPFLKDAVTIVANHQERWDGSGYPTGLKGNDIPLLARIFSVADVFDALISDRPYHAKISPMDAMEYLKFQANTLFDPQIIRVFSVIYERPNFLRQMGFYEL